MENKYGKPSKLLIDADIKDGRTYLKDVYFSAPFKIMNPFYKNKDYMTIICMSSSSGIMAGDTQEYQILAREGSKVEFTSQEYEKINKMEDGSATRSTELTIRKNAELYYNPQPTIPFAHSAFESTVNVYLFDASSRFIMKEILSSGRSSRGENFEYRYYHNLVNVYDGGQLIYRDNSRFDPSRMDLGGIGIYEGHERLGNLLLFHLNKDADWIRRVRELIDEEPDTEGGVTALPNDGIIIRVLGSQSDKIDRLFNKILAL